MTHDELLARLESEDILIDYQEFEERNDALIAVLKLHKPIQYGTTLKTRTGCNACENNDKYPCPTIQSIEKELR